MNRRGLMGWLVLAGILVVVFMGAGIYLSFSQTGASLHTGDVTFSVDYGDDEKPAREGGRIVEIDPEGEIIPPGEITPEINETSNITQNNNTLVFENISE